jgi:hypothetical protein
MTEMSSALTVLTAHLESPGFKNDILRIERVKDELIIVLRSEEGLKSITHKLEQLLADVDPAKTISILYVYNNGRIAYP